MTLSFCQSSTNYLIILKKPALNACKSDSTTSAVLAIWILCYRSSILLTHLEMQSWWQIQKLLCFIKSNLCSVICSSLRDLIMFQKIFSLPLYLPLTLEFNRTLHNFWIFYLIRSKNLLKIPLIKNCFNKFLEATKSLKWSVMVVAPRDRDKNHFSLIVLKYKANMIFTVL